MKHIINNIFIFFTFSAEVSNPPLVKTGVTKEKRPSHIVQNLYCIAVNAEYS